MNNEEINILCYCAGCGRPANLKPSEYIKRPHPVYFCPDCERYDEHWCIWGEPTETQNPYMVRHCVKKDVLVMRVSCTKACEYWKEYTDPKLSPEELILVKEKWKIAGYCLNAEKESKGKPILVTEGVCAACTLDTEPLHEYPCPICKGKIMCRSSQYFTDMLCEDCDKLVQEERAREHIQKDGIPAQKNKPKGKISVQKRLF